MTTMATTVAAVRRILNDDPYRDKLGAAMADTTTATFTPTDATLYQKGLRIEWDDGGTTSAEQALVSAVDTSTPLVTVLHRGMYGSTAATHANGTDVLISPRWPYDTVAQAVNTAIDGELYQSRIYDINEHQVTSSASTFAYNAPSTSCEEWLGVYQKTTSMTEPMQITDFTRLPKNVDTSLYANGRYFEIFENLGVAGTDLFYVNCAHKLTISTLTTPQERIVQFLACAYLLEWTEPRRTAGPANQGDQTVRVGSGAGTAAYYRGLAARLIDEERSYLKTLNPPWRLFRREN